MKIEMREDKNLWVTFNPEKGDPREVVFDEKVGDVRICNGKEIITVNWNNGAMLIYRNDLLISGPGQTLPPLPDKRSTFQGCRSCQVDCLKGGECRHFAATQRPVECRGWDNPTWTLEEGKLKALQGWREAQKH